MKGKNAFTLRDLNIRLDSPYTGSLSIHKFTCLLTNQEFYSKYTYIVNLKSIPYKITILREILNLEKKFNIKLLSKFDEFKNREDKLRFLDLSTNIIFISRFSSVKKGVFPDEVQVRRKLLKQNIIILGNYYKNYNTYQFYNTETKETLVQIKIELMIFPHYINGLGLK